MITEDQLLSFKEWFNRYVKGYSFANNKYNYNIELKIKHTYKVCEEIKDLGQSLNLSQKDLYLAEVIALFHDVGRFEQYAEYKTFSDFDSINHATLGIEILKKEGVLSNLDQETKNLIIEAISYHNQAQIPSNKDERKLLFIKLIRDADKLDIWRVVLEHYDQEDKKGLLGVDLINSSEITDKIYNQAFTGEVVQYKNLRTITDLKILQMGWVYDINFKRSFEIIKKREYLDRIFATMPKTERVRRLYKRLMQVVEE